MLSVVNEDVAHGDSSFMPLPMNMIDLTDRINGHSKNGRRILGISLFSCDFKELCIFLHSALCLDFFIKSDIKLRFSQGEYVGRSTCLVEDFIQMKNSMESGC